MIRREIEKSKFRVVQMDSLRGLLHITRINKVPLFKVTNRVHENIDESVHQWFGHIEKMRNGRIAKSMLLVL